MTTSSYTVSPYLDIEDPDFYSRVIESHTMWISTEQAMARASGQALAALTFFSLDNYHCALFHVDMEKPIYVFVTPEEGNYIEAAMDKGDQKVEFTWCVIEIAYNA